MQWNAEGRFMSCPKLARDCPIVRTWRGLGARLTRRPGMLTGRPAAARTAMGRLGATGSGTHNPRLGAFAPFREGLRVRSHPFFS